MNVEDVKARTVYIVAEIFNDGFVFERLGTCPPEHEHLTPSEAALCGHNNPAGRCGPIAVDSESRESPPTHSRKNRKKYGSFGVPLPAKDC